MKHIFISSHNKKWVLQKPNRMIHTEQAIKWR